jgi:hypothetical protein
MQVDRVIDFILFICPEGETGAAQRGAELGTGRRGL